MVWATGNAYAEINVIKCVDLCWDLILRSPGFWTLQQVDGSHTSLIVLVSFPGLTVDIYQPVKGSNDPVFHYTEYFLILFITLAFWSTPPQPAS